MISKLNAQALAVTYKNPQTHRVITALDGINFAVQEGQFIAIVGPSGCGKSTLLNVIAGLQPATAGEILLNGQPITGPGPDRAMVFQAPALLPWRTVRRNVTYGLELQGWRQTEANARAQQYLDLVGLTGFEASYPHELSGGMQQRVNLARALAIQPDLLLFDEPLAALDAQTRAYMQWELQRIWLRTRNTALFVTHQISEAIYLADEVLVMSARPGRIKAVIPVALPRPRALAVQQEPYFNGLERQIWGLLQEEALKMGMVIDESLVAQ